MFFVHQPVLDFQQSIQGRERNEIAIIGLGKISALTENFLSKDFKIYGFDKKRELPNSYIGNFTEINNLKDFLNCFLLSLFF